MVTHEPDIARYTKRNVVMRDGVVITDKPVTNRFNAVEEMVRLREEHQAVHLTP